MAVPPYSSDDHTHLQRSLRALAERTHNSAAAVASRRLDVSTGFGGVDGVGVTVLLGDESVFAGSNAFTEAIDMVQYGLNQGPCLSAVATRRVVTSTRIGAGESRWGNFTPRAATLELRGVASVPVVADGEVVGSLNVYSRDALGLQQLPPKVLSRLARAAEATVTGIQLLHFSRVGALQLFGWLDDLAAIEHAIGVIMGRFSINANRAQTLLTQLARHNGTTEALAAQNFSYPSTRGLTGTGTADVRVADPIDDSGGSP